MRKSEIKQGVKSIMEAITTARENIDEFLQPYKDIKEHLEAIQSIEEDNGLETGFDYEEIENDTLRSCISESGDIQDIENQFEMLMSDLENWQDESSEKKSEQIQEQYVDVLSEIKESFDIDSIECEEDVDDRLYDMINSLEDMEI
ncbi:hypothetical protein [Clostridium botulinum]|uniref:hypothetical protein n=1 Tax=Clostridium botulinum TaxID=1491 RepID=UPI001C9AF0D0|nr:hypothetical protein [Clostridium botulinum]MBY6838762.1 hypothetical protein [Clostridium botulinum]